MTVSADQEKKVFARIDELRDEIIRVALSLSDMDASMPHREGEPPPRRGVGDIKYHERRAAEWVEAWMRENGFETKRQGAPDRFDMLGIHRGTGGGRSILFNSHMDVSYRPLTHCVTGTRSCGTGSAPGGMGTRSWGRGSPTVKGPWPAG